MISNLQVSATTTVVGLLGHPVRHSFSPTIHNAAFAHLGLDWVFTVFDVAPQDGMAAIEACRVLGIEGLSVTMPHKANVAATVDELTETATKLNAVNCVFRRHGKMVGDNTDGAGFVASLWEEASFDPADKRCVVFGAGGAARAVILALAEAGASEITVVNRTTETGFIAAGLAPQVATVGDATAVLNADLVVNCTSLGMHNDADTAQVSRTPVAKELLGPNHVVAELVYHPLETRLMTEARQQGATVVGGLGMLVHQAAVAFTTWTGETAPLAIMREAVQSRLSQTGPH